MDKTKQLEKFIQKSIKRKDEIVDENELLSLFDEMTTNEIIFFWFNYSGDISFSKVIARIPDWRTKERERYLTDLVGYYHYTPKEKDKNGKYILDRNDLINHVKSHLIIIIQSEIIANYNYKNSPLLEKIPYYLIRLPIIIILIPFVSLFFFNNKVWESIYGVCLFIFLFNLLLYLIVYLIISCRHDQKVKIKNST